MFFKIVLVAIFSIFLTGCNNKTSQNSLTTDENSYSRLGYENIEPQNNEENTFDKTGENIENSGESYILSGDKTNSNLKTPQEEKKDYMENNVQNKDDGSLSTYTTKILTSDANRYHNITIVRDRLNGYILKNGEIFSYNEVCGPYGKDDGFKEATILLSNGEHEKGYGGGVCQLSSTLYNAIKNLDIDITERHNHSTPVAYVPKNEDATVSLQSNLDFKFKNTSGKDLKFVCTSTPNSLTVSVYPIY